MAPLRVDQALAQLASNDSGCRGRGCPLRLAHQGEGSETITQHGSFVAPDHDYPSHLELRLTVTDSGALTDTASVRLDPRTVTLTLRTRPRGLDLVFNASEAVAPFTRTVIEGSRHTISAPSPQRKAKKQWQFRRWSDGGAQTHDVIANAAATYRARFKRR